MRPRATGRREALRTPIRRPGTSRDRLVGARLLVTRNVAKATLFLGGFAALLTALGWWLGGVRLAGLFLVAALLIVGTLYRSGWLWRLGFRGLGST